MFGDSAGKQGGDIHKLGGDIHCRDEGHRCIDAEGYKLVNVAGLLQDLNDIRVEMQHPSQHLWLRGLDNPMALPVVLHSD